ncbi:MAG: Crp/Fnr family transcriptional regulator [Bacteroidia bacterium]|nr:Crp/Fnr family transcriptional regulator [Bacteroidia bacterium]
MINIDLLLAMGAVYKRVSQGEMIFMEGNPGSYYFQLVEGRVNWVNINEDGKEYLQSVIEPGECFGEFPLFDDEPYAASAVAEQDSILLKLPKERFHQLLAEHPDIHLAFSKLLVHRLRFKFYLLKELLNHQPEERIAALFKYMRESRSNVCLHCGKVKLTRQQIANMTCLRVETVIRAIRNMHERGEVSIQKGKVYFNNMSGITSSVC